MFLLYYIMKFNIDENIKHSSGIYIISAIGSDDFYIGSAIDFHRRYRSYTTTLKNSFYMSKKMSEFVNLYGYKNLVFSLYVEVKDIEKIGIMEKFILQNLEPPLNNLNSSRRGIIKGKQYFKNISLPL